MYSNYPGHHAERERGQTTIALAGVLAAGCLAAVAISIIGQAMVHRSHARNAADAVALATAVDPAAAGELHAWYGDRGIAVEQLGERTVARSGPSQAAAWASTSAAANQPAPAMVAILARAEQLLQVTLEPLRWSGIEVQLSAADATYVREVAAELGLCEVDAASDTDTFELC